MHKTLLDFKTTAFFSDIVNDYLEDLPALKEFYNLSFELNSFQKLIEQRSYSDSLRPVLADAISSQYETAGIKLVNYDKLNENIGLLRNESTYTVTTGHQLCLFTGPLYFIYKIFSTINLCEELKKKYPAYNFVPVYWMATEDHDFEEINHFQLFGKKFSWNAPEKGATGKIPTTSLNELFEELVKVFGDREEGKRLADLFEKSYLQNNDLAAATRYLVNELFGKYGLVCLDPDVAAFKAAFKEIMYADLMANKAYELVNETNERLGEKYKIQVNPREINLFYLQPGSRERILKNEKTGNFELADSGKVFSQEEMTELLDKFPERFSPNVILRPMYQEVILPNLAYIGGGAEIAYWLQLKATFDHFNVAYPIIALRNSVLWIDKNSYNKLKKNNINSVEEVFTPVKELLSLYAQRASTVDMELEEEKKAIDTTFAQLTNKVGAIDNGLMSYVKAEHQKSLNMLNDLKSKMTRAEKKNNETGVKQLEAAKDKLFPNGGLQERYDNFATFYLMNGETFFDVLKNSLNPLSKKFIVFSEESL